MATCPECDAEIEVDEFDVDKGDQLSCPECGSNLEVVALAPLELDLAPAGRSDDHRTTIDYGDVCRRVLSIGEGAPVRLLERLADRIAECCLQEYPAVGAVEVAVRKRLPPLPVNLLSVEVRIRRARVIAATSEEE